LSAPLPVLNPSADKPALALDPRAVERGLSCVHCGLCLPACPTYTETGLEADSPRGRIQLMLGLAEGKIEPSDSVRRHLDLCLDCRGCETACPSGVVYHELIEETRDKLTKTQTRSAQEKFMRWLFFHVFTKPARLKLALLPARLLQKVGIYPLLRDTGMFKLLPDQLRKMEQMLPPEGRLWPSSSMGILPMPKTKKHGQDAHATEVGFFQGCIGAVMFDKINQQAAELLAACSATVIAPRAQRCCGAIHLHGGAHAPAEEMARRNIDAFFPAGQHGPDFIVSTVAGCGAMLKEYDVLLRDDPRYSDRARQFASRVRDISEVLLELGLPELRYPVNQTVTYHDACHLAHAQKVTAPPRKLLEKIAGLKLVPLPEGDMCCGAAGTYNLTEPEMATALARRKLCNILATGAHICATGNVGCAMQIAAQARADGQHLSVVHPVELLHKAMFGDNPPRAIDT
jgi:glycolate oxidase iron-sulfur subunit